MKRIKDIKNPFAELHVLLNIAMLVPSVLVSWFCLLMGFAHLYEGLTDFGLKPGDDVGESILGWTFVILLCVIGIITAVIVIALASAIGRQVRSFFSS